MGDSKVMHIEATASTGLEALTISITARNLGHVLDALRNGARDIQSGSDHQKVLRQLYEICHEAHFGDTCFN